jgi:hypothetical protein
VHACGEEVHAGRVGPDEATAILQTSVNDLFTVARESQPLPE